MENLSRALRACALEQAVIALNLWVKASVVDGANARAHPLTHSPNCTSTHPRTHVPASLHACVRARVHTRRRTQTHADTRTRT